MDDADEQVTIAFEEASALLNVPCSTLSRWVRQGKIPCRRQGVQILFSRSDILSWAQEHDIPLIKTPTHCHGPVVYRFSDLADAVRRGGVHRLHVSSLKELFEQVVSILNPVSDLGQDELVDALLEREAMASTAMGQSIAFPHPRLPERFHFHTAVVGLFYLETPISFNAPDDESVSVIFPLFTPDTRTHLRLISLLSQLLRQKGTKEYLELRPPCEEFLSWLIECE